VVSATTAPAGTDVPAGDVLGELQRRGVADASASVLTRSLYASDASIYRVEPLAVARPRHPDELAAVLDVVTATGVPLTMRGAGTSIAGNAVGPGLVVDVSRHLNRVLSLDAEARTAVVQPGAVHATLQRRAAAAGLRFGPDPSTHTRCTIGGMIGNNACGSRALGYGRTADNVVALDALTVDGRPVGEETDRLRRLVDENLGVIRPRFGRFGRQVSGYSLEHLLPEHGRSLERFLVGSEGTLAVVTGATVRLVQDPPVRVLAVLGYPTMADAADAVPAVLEHGPVAAEGLDERMTSLVAGAPALPRGGGWLLVELTGDVEAEVVARARAVVADAGALDAQVVTDVVEQQALWRIREDGAGLASRTTTPPGQAGWEDAAVPPARLGDYLREFDALLSQHGYHGAPYGHFGDGCVHIRIDFELSSAPGRAGYRAFVEDAARLAASYGGSMSGEHGDGRARSELLPVMYDEPALTLFGEVKRIFDPRNLLNPGVLVDPAPLDDDVRLAGVPAEPPRTALTLLHDAGDVTAAVHRCTGVGKCLADSTAGGGIMCPSFQATREEKDSTRGRARVLQDAVTGRLPGGWADPAVHDALDLCLACKGCARDCPTGVDMATYKVEALHQTYAGRRRPLTHYTLGRLPQLLARVPAGLANLGLRATPRLAASMAGVDTRRSLPVLARRPLSRRSRLEAPTTPDVVVWADTFTNRFTPQVAEAAVRVLEAAGQRVAVHAQGDECCGLTLVSTGQLDAARRTLAALTERLTPYVEAGVPVVVLEPSCLAVLRHDAGELLGASVRGVVTLAEHLATLDWAPPSLEGLEVVAQPHCHHASVLGWETDAALLRGAGASLTRVGGCCGLAGNFGMEKGHYDVSVKVFEHDLGPAVAAAGPAAVVLADGFSCRTQLADLADAPSLHLAELLASRLPDSQGPR
jgi:FAD/FMN-containing dehydrogenase/Fe-S oxidoreductase